MFSDQKWSDAYDDQKTVSLQYSTNNDIMVS